MLACINKLRQQSQEGNQNAQMALFSKLYSDPKTRAESINMCGNLRQSNFYLLGVFHFLNIVETDNSEFVVASDDFNLRKNAAFQIFNTFAHPKVETTEIYFIWTMLGLCHSQGIGTPKNREQAKFWCQKAALGGNEYACYNLGYMYETDGNLDLAIIEFEKAAELYHNDAILALGPPRGVSYLCQSQRV